jgi:hypothetical protein
MPIGDRCGLGEAGKAIARVSGRPSSGPHRRVGSIAASDAERNADIKTSLCLDVSTAAPHEQSVARRRQRDRLRFRIDRVGILSRI